FNPKLDREEKKRHWEIDIKATRTQLVLPPSIHPDTGLSYIWEREFDPDFAYLYVVPQETIDNWNVRTSSEEIEIDDEDDLAILVNNEPIDIDDDKVEEMLNDLPPDWVEDREYWFTVGAALHHQYRGSDKGFEI